MLILRLRALVKQANCVAVSDLKRLAKTETKRLAEAC